jgi:hypothetical protein
LLTGKLARLRRRLQILDDEKKIMLFFCDAPSWVCLLYAKLWYGGVPEAPDMKPRFIFGYVIPVVL